MREVQFSTGAARPNNAAVGEDVPPWDLVYAIDDEALKERQEMDCADQPKKLSLIRKVS